MIVPKISIEKRDFSLIGEKLALLEKHTISHQNWTDYKQYPNVTFQIGHDSENIYLRFDVRENEVRAVATENNGKVWEDSCVEFFVSFDNSGFYYNLEQTCIGTALMGYRKERENPTHATDQILDSIKRWASLGGESFEVRQGDFNWTLISVIPVNAFWNHGLKAFDGVKARANFYKCGDKLTKPHFLSWNPVEIEKPDFHRIDFFQEIIFE